jgi:hypothetical protein
MRPFLVRFNEPVWSGHAPSWADLITTTPELKFSVNTGIADVSVAGLFWSKLYSAMTVID